MSRAFAAACRDITRVFPADVWDTVLQLLRPEHPWQICRWGFPGLPDRAQLLIFDFCATIDRHLPPLNGHLLTGRYPRDFVFPHALARVVAVRQAWWVHWFPISEDDDLSNFYAWLTDGFPIWIRGVVHRQLEDFERRDPRIVGEEEAETLLWEDRKKHELA